MAGRSSRAFVAVANGLRGGLDGGEGEVFPSDPPWSARHELSGGQHLILDESTHDGVAHLEDRGDLFQGQPVWAGSTWWDPMVVANAGDPRRSPGQPMPGSVADAIEDVCDGRVVTDTGQVTDEFDGFRAHRATVLAGAIPRERQLGMNAPAPMQPEQVAGRIVGDRKSTRLNSSHIQKSRMPSSA